MVEKKNKKPARGFLIRNQKTQRKCFSINHQRYQKNLVESTSLESNNSVSGAAAQRIKMKHHVTGFFEQEPVHITISNLMFKGNTANSIYNLKQNRLKTWRRNKHGWWQWLFVRSQKKKKPRKNKAVGVKNRTRPTFYCWRKKINFWNEKVNQ